MEGKQTVYFEDLGKMDYKAAWDYQELLMRRNLDIKEQLRAAEEQRMSEIAPGIHPTQPQLEHHADALEKTIFHPGPAGIPATTNHLLFVEHPPVYTLGKSGKIEHVLIDEEERTGKGIEFYQTNRGGDITFHGPDQVVGYPIMDLENFYTDIGRYLRDLEEVIILTLADHGIAGGRSSGETGVWIDALEKGKERKICAMGVRCSRWVTMHGFALNVNTDLRYFDHIIPCGIQDKKVTSMQAELGKEVDMEQVKKSLRKNFSTVFGVTIVNR